MIRYLERWVIVTKMKNELEEKLKKLVLEIQQNLPQTPQRQRLFNRLFSEIQQSKKLGHYHSICPSYLKGCYEEIYAESLQELFLYLIKKIADYDPNQGEVLPWANGILKWRFLDVVRKWQQSTQNLEQTIPILSLENLEDLDKMSKPVDLKPSLSEQVINIISEDPEKIFQQTYTSGNPLANFQFIALKRAEKETWQTLSKQLNIPIPALSNFYQRCLKRFPPLIKKYLLE